MAKALEARELVELAGRLREAEPGGWTQAGLRALASALGWDWRDAAGGPLLETGLPTGPARLRPIGRIESSHVRNGEEYLALRVPVAVVQDGPRGKADAFRRAAAALTEAFGRAPIMGAHGDPGPFYDAPPSWGSPFLRWRGPADSLELGACEEGVELVLQPNDPVENWHWRQGHGEPYALGGFFGTDRSPANGGLGLPGGWRTDDWDVFATALGTFLQTLPAETRALGIFLDLAAYGRIPGSGQMAAFRIACGDAMEISCYEDLGAGLDSIFGDWHSPAAVPMRMEHVDEIYPSAFHTGVLGPGEVDGKRLARTLVEAAMARGTASPRGLTLIDHAQRVGHYHVDFYGLTLSESR